MCRISTQLSRIALLEIAQLKSSVFVLASMLVRRGCVVQRAGQGDQKGFEVGGQAQYLYVQEPDRQAAPCAPNGRLARRKQPSSSCCFYHEKILCEKRGFVVMRKPLLFTPQLHPRVLRQ
jgi:hypothetical protein